MVDDELVANVPSQELALELKHAQTASRDAANGVDLLRQQLENHARAAYFSETFCGEIRALSIALHTLAVRELAAHESKVAHVQEKIAQSCVKQKK